MSKFYLFDNNNNKDTKKNNQNFDYKLISYLWTQDFFPISVSLVSLLGLFLKYNKKSIQMAFRNLCFDQDAKGSDYKISAIFIYCIIEVAFESIK